MPFTKDKFTLFFSLPLDSTDHANLRTSRVTRVMVPLAFATPEALRSLRREGVRNVVVRVDEPDYRNYERRLATRSQVSTLRAVEPGLVDTIIVGVEPENGVNWLYGSPSWEQDRAEEHAIKLSAMRDMLISLGVKVVSAGWTMRSISEDDPPQPGKVAWREECREAYHGCDFCGYHLYQHGWESEVDVLRVKWALKGAMEMWHKPLWIDEVGVNSGPSVERMRAYTEIATMLLGHPRVEALTPFVSNGTPNGQWSEGLLLRDPACYALLGSWMQS